jgi:hypothetical protein
MAGILTDPDHPVGIYKDFPPINVLKQYEFHNIPLVSVISGLAMVVVSTRVGKNGELRTTIARDTGFKPFLQLFTRRSHPICH